MIVVRLREVMERHRRRTGIRLTYRELAERTGLSESTVQSIGARPSYNTTLGPIDLLCRALNCSVEDLLEHGPDASEKGKPGRKRRNR